MDTKDTNSQHERSFFISSTLDDFGLNPLQFRVYSKICSGCNSVEEMSDACETDEQSVIEILMQLEAHRLIVPENGHYVLTPDEVWIPINKGGHA